jgi:tellurite resistance protein TerC
MNSSFPYSYTYLYPFGDYWGFYLLFTLFILFILALDLGVFHRKPHEVAFREAFIWSIVWVTLALCFNALFYYFSLYQFSHDPRLLSISDFNPQSSAWRSALEFLTGYIIEKSLAVDNIFVFVVIFSFFSVPGKIQHRVLFYGIIGALVFRAIFTAIGSALIAIHWVEILLGVFLIITGIKIILAPEKQIDPENNKVLKLLNRYLPVHSKLEGDRFFIRDAGKLLATPLLVCLIFIELSDIVFAIDSVPAIFAITNEPLIVYTSNIFAILGLRAMYFLLASVVKRFYLLKYGLAIVLVFVGLKMAFLNDYFGGKFPIFLSLLIIVSVIGLSIALSLLMPKQSIAHRDA